MKRVKKLGNSMKNVIIINALIPFLFIYGKERGKNDIVIRRYDGWKS